MSEPTWEEIVAGIEDLEDRLARLAAAWQSARVNRVRASIEHFSAAMHEMVRNEAIGVALAVLSTVTPLLEILEQR
jgi:hypothetical protein